MKKWQAKTGGGVADKKKEIKKCQVGQVSFLHRTHHLTKRARDEARARKAARYPEARPRRHQPTLEKEHEDRAKGEGT